MKTLLTVIALCSSMSVFASTCFKATSTPSLDSKLPEIVCVDEAKFETVLPGLPRSPYYAASVVTSIGSAEKEVRFSGSQKGPFKVSVSLPLNSVAEGTCSYYYQSSLEVRFMVNAQGEVLEDSLSVDGHVIENNDPCHLNDSRTTVLYSRI